MYEYLGQVKLNVSSSHECNIFKTIVVDEIHEGDLRFLFKKFCGNSEMSFTSTRPKCAH